MQTEAPPLICCKNDWTDVTMAGLGGRVRRLRRILMMSVAATAAMSGALPGQPGLHHVSGRSNAFVARLFAELGYTRDRAAEAELRGVALCACVKL